MNKKIIIAVAITCALGGAVVHASSHARIESKSDLSARFDSLVTTYPEHKCVIRQLEKDLGNAQVSCAKFLVKVITAKRRMPVELSDEVLGLCPTMAEFNRLARIARN